MHPQGKFPIRQCTHLHMMHMMHCSMHTVRPNRV
jgi:hypothetical protein